MQPFFFHNPPQWVIFSIILCQHDVNILCIYLSHNHLCVVMNCWHVCLPHWIVNSSMARIISLLVVCPQCFSCGQLLNYKLLGLRDTTVFQPCKSRQHIFPWFRSYVIGWLLYLIARCGKYQQNSSNLYEENSGFCE